MALLGLAFRLPAVAQRERPKAAPAAAPAAKRVADSRGRAGSPDYRIGPEDLLEVTVFEAPELDRTVRVSAEGKISLPLLGAVRAEGRTTRQLEGAIEALLRRSYMKDPHVSVFVKQIESHPVSVFGAVMNPGVYQIRGPRGLVEVLAKAGGLASDAGDTVIVTRHAAGGADGRTLRIPVNDLLESAGTRDDVRIDPGDVVKVTRAGVVYVVGEVRRPGGFTLRTNESMSVLQALALAEGLTQTSAAKHALIIRTLSQNGERENIPINLDKILRGRAPDPLLRARDVVFVPNSASRTAFYRGAEAALSIAAGLIVYRR